VSRRGWTVAAVAAAVAGGAAWAVATGNEARPAPRGRPATATVERRDLVERETFDGTLGYSDARTLTGALTGTITSLRPEGAVVRRGRVLYRVDGTAVRLLLGRIPAWRAFAEGMSDGEDVRQLERNLVALGHDPDGDVDVDDEFDWATEDAIRRWEEDLGLEEDGQIPLGEVAFLPGPARVGQHHIEVGSSVGPGGQVMDVSSTEQVVTVDLEADRQDLVRRGDRVEVELPDGRRARGVVTEVGRVAERDVEDEEAEPTIEVTISPRGERGRALDQAPVDVDIEVARAEGVLAVPVAALLALAEGGYAVEVVEDGGARHLVGVETGAYADGWVEISVDGIGEGTRVVVPE